MTTITSPHGTTTPTLWMDYASTREAGTIAHQLMSGGVAVVHRPTGPRASSLALLYSTEGAADAAERLLAKGGVFTIQEDDFPTTASTFVVVGGPGREYNAEAPAWIVSADVQAVV